MLEIALSQASSIIPAVLSSALALVISKALVAWLNAREARWFADNTAFKDALATANLETVGGMLRDRFGNVSLQAFLDDPVTQKNVSSSLKRLAEVVNQPSVDPLDEETVSRSEVYDSILHGDQSIPPNQRKRRMNYVDSLDQADRATIGSRIVEIAEATELRVHGVSIWNALATARRELEKEILPKLPVSLEFLSPRIFHDPQLRNAMGAFLHVANRAIHGEEVTLEKAEKCLSALRFAGERLQGMLPNPEDENAQPGVD